jgi:periplasmic copper chaperone A
MQSETAMNAFARSTVLAVLVLLAGAGAGLAHGYKLGDLAIGHPWARAAPGGMKVSGGYLSITNNGTVPDRLTGATFSEADHVEIHEMKMEGDVMKMRPLPDGVEVKPGETVKLAPSGIHLMLKELKTPLKKGDMVAGSLTFEKAGKVDVEFKIEDAGAMGPGQGDHMKMEQH